MSESERTGAAEGVTGEEGDGWKWEIDDRSEEGVEAIAVGKGIGVCFVELEALYFRCRPRWKKL